ncbi:MAG: DUF2282 domain-containing protein [Rickettsiales bacterium]|nr:DUF2282 domain-containing protein [Rickettsiales bacterium]
MDKKQKLLIATTILAAIQASSAAAHMEPKQGDGMEKCYGVSKAGVNECASKANKHGCAGMAKTDNDPNEWITLPIGECAKLPNSSTTPKDKS